MFPMQQVFELLIESESQPTLTPKSCVVWFRQQRYVVKVREREIVSEVTVQNTLQSFPPHNQML